MNALVLPDRELIEDLISINPIVDQGYKVTFEPYDRGGAISKDGIDLVPIRREGSMWLMDINRLKCLVAGTKPDGLVEKVMSLHKRMEHASFKNMIAAMKSGSWTNADVSADEIRTVMDATPCPGCLMAKRNKDPIPQSVTDPREVPIGHLISGDIIGPIKPAAAAIFLPFC